LGLTNETAIRLRILAQNVSETIPVAVKVLLQQWNNLPSKRMVETVIVSNIHEVRMPNLMIAILSQHDSLVKLLEFKCAISADYVIKQFRFNTRAGGVPWVESSRLERIVDV
jgi:hypothetical protein